MTDTLSKEQRIAIIDTEIEIAEQSGHTSIIPPLHEERDAIANEMDMDDVLALVTLDVQPSTQNHFTPTDGINPAMWGEIDQLCIDKSAEQIDRQLAQLGRA
jgi:hypothetical protein